MSDESSRLPLENRLSGFMTELTVRERRILLAVCAIGLTIAKIGLVPTKITALGIEFSATNQQTMLAILAVIIAYFLLAFVVYAAGDYLASETRYAKSAREGAWEWIAGQQPVQKLQETVDSEKKVELLRVYAKYPFPNPKTVVGVRWARIFVDLIIPPLLAILTILILVTTKPPA